MPGYRPTLPRAAVKQIQSAVENLFDRMKTRYLGPHWSSKYGSKAIAIGYKPELSLPGLYLAGVEEERAKPNMDTLNALARVAEGYIEAQREVTKARVVKAVSDFLQEAAAGKVDTDLETVLGGELANVWGQAAHAVKRIIDTESTQARNVGTLEGISRVNAYLGVEDPVVYFVVVQDTLLCDECKRLHLMPDGHTPRLWKMSEVGHSYHKRGEPEPKVGGLHPHCFTAGMKLHTGNGVFSMQELYELGLPVSVVVDSRVKNRREGNNQFGKELPGKVWFHRNVKGARTLPATPVYDTGVQECLRLTLDSGHELEVSVGHEQWVDDGLKGVKVRADLLRVGDKIPVLSGEGGFGTDYFPLEAELMGNLMGDGSLGNTAQFNFFGADIEYGRRLKQLAQKISPSLSGCMTIVPPDEKYSVEHAQFNSTVLALYFTKEFGLSKTPRRVPKRLWGATKETVQAFLRGLYAADGHSERAGGLGVVLAQNDLVFLKELQILLSNLGYVARIFDHGQEQEKIITYANGDQFTTTRQPCWRMSIGGFEQVDRFSREIGLGVPAKQDLLLQRIEASRGKDIHGAWRTARIEKIENIGLQQTYCLTEHMTNTVTVNGIVTGQCRCTMASLTPGWGFDAAGFPKYIGQGHDEYAIQQGMAKSEGPWTPCGCPGHLHPHQERILALKPLAKSEKA